MAIRQRMYQPKVSELHPDWHVIDADGKTLGRLSTEIASLLQGKHRPSYVTYVKTRHYLILVKADKI